MLKEVHIRNYVLIESLDIEFNDGFSVLTGETGAGKSIILGALNLLLGGRADSKSISTNETKCTIEGRFSIDGYGMEQFFDSNELDWDPADTIMRRELYSTGKSRAFINDTPVTLNQLRELGCRLIDIHSQHQNLALGTQPFQLDVVDTISANPSVKAEYVKCYNNWSCLKERLSRLKSELETENADREYLTFQLEGLESARLQDGEQEELEQECTLLNHAEEIKQEMHKALDSLSNDECGVITNLSTALQCLRSSQRNYPKIQEVVERVESCLIEIKDIAATTYQEQEGISCNPSRLEQVNSRLDLINSLLKKHKRATIAELLELAHNLQIRLTSSEDLEYEIEQLETQVKKAHILMTEQARKLTASRKQASQAIMNEIKKLLVPLGIPNVQFGIEIEPSSTYDTTGADDLKFMFSANKSVPMQELAAVASGGETARIMLCIKSLMAGARSLPTIVFDEIDTGVSGAVAEQMALLMKQMSHGGRQVLAITHLPQIAALGETHYKVFKRDDQEATHTHIAVLRGDDRIHEIAGMMSGSTLTQAALDNARALITNNGR